MLELAKSTVFDTDKSEGDFSPGAYRDGLNISLIANALLGFTKGTTYGNINSNVKLDNLSPEAICLGSAIDVAKNRAVVAFFQRTQSPFISEYTAIIDYAISRGFVLPSPNVQAAQNKLIVLMKESGIWAVLDRFYNFVSDGDQDFCKINWKNPSDATQAVNNGMAWGFKNGFKGDGVTSFMDMKFTPSTHGSNYTLNTAGVITALSEIVQDAEGVFDGTSLTSWFHFVSPDDISGTINGGSAVLFSNPQFSNDDGVISIARAIGASVNVKKNGSSTINVASSAIALPTLSYYIGARNNNGAPADFGTTRYRCWGIGGNFLTNNLHDRFTSDWSLYMKSVSTPVLDDSLNEVLMYLITLPVPSLISPVLKSAVVGATERSYFDGHVFVEDLFYFNFKEAAPKVINLKRVIDTPGFYNSLGETSLTLIKPRPPLAPTAVRATTVSAPLNPTIQKRAFQFMFVYHFVDGEQSAKSPASVMLNSLDDVQAETQIPPYDHIDVTIAFPVQDYPIIESIELFVRGSNNLGDWRGAVVLQRSMFTQVGSNFQLVYAFFDNVIGSLLPVELATKVNDAIPLQSNYLSFIENRIFLIDTVIDYDLLPTWQLLLTLDANSNVADDRLLSTPIYAEASWQWDSEYTIGLAFYDKYGRKYPSTVADRKLVTPRFTPIFYNGADALPDNTTITQLQKAKITSKFDLRAVTDVTKYGKPPDWAYYWGLIRTENTKWEFYQEVKCLLRFPYSATPYTGGTLPADTFLEDGYVYWDPTSLLATSPASVANMVNDYIDVVVPANFPYPLDTNIMIDFVMAIEGSGGQTLIQDRSVITTFSNKVRIRGNRLSRWFTNVTGQYKKYPKFSTGVNLDGGQTLTRDETFFLVVIKRRRTSALQQLVLYDTPHIFPIFNPGTRFASFQNQTVTLARTDFAPLFIAPPSTSVLEQGWIVVQPLNIVVNTVGDNHSLKVLWGANTGGSLSLRVKASIYELDSNRKPVRELYSATSDNNGPFFVKNAQLAEYFITSAQLPAGWYGYGIQVLPYNQAGFQFSNIEFDEPLLAGWLQSSDMPAQWFAATVGVDNVAFVNIADMAGSYSKSLYQLLDGATKLDVQVEAVIEAVNILGPATGGSVVLNPGNVNDSTQILRPSHRNVIPVFIDCTTTPRTVTLTNVSVNLATVAITGSTLRAELWSLNQTTKEPIALIASFSGPDISVQAVGNYILPFAAGANINTTAWYGISLYFNGPTNSDFFNKNFDHPSGPGFGWNAIAGANQWQFSTGGTLPPSHPTSTFSPAFGTALGFRPMQAPVGIVQPIFIGNSIDPDGWINWLAKVEWGPNEQNGWGGVPCKFILWEVDQGTMEPLTKLASANSNVGTSVEQLQFITSSKFDENLWYGIGIDIVGPHPTGPTGPITGSTTWTADTATWPNTSSAKWNSGGPSNSMQNGPITLSSSLVVTGEIYTNNPSTLPTYIQPVIIMSFQFDKSGSTGSPITGVVMKAKLLRDHVVIQERTIPLVGSLFLFGQSLNSRASVSFDPIAPAGSVIGFQYTFEGTGSETLSMFGTTGFFNGFDPMRDATPYVKRYGIADADNEVWIAYGDKQMNPEFKMGFDYWGTSIVFAGGSMPLLSGSTPLTMFIVSTGFSASSGLLYENLRMEASGSAITFTFTLNGYYYSFLQDLDAPYDIELWYFDDPDTFDTTGTLFHTFNVDPSTLTFSSFKAPISPALSVSQSIPAGTKYWGIRVTNPSGQTFTTQGVELTSLTRTTGTSMPFQYKTGYTNGIKAQVADTVPGPTVDSNAYVPDLAVGVTSKGLGQDFLLGEEVSFDMLVESNGLTNSFTIFIRDKAGVLLGSESNVGVTTNVSFNYSIPISGASTDGLYISIRNDGATVSTYHIRGVTNDPAFCSIQADGSSPASPTWVVTPTSGNELQATGGVIVVNATEDVPQPPSNLSVVLADNNGVPISAPQSLTPNAGKQTLLLSPTLAVQDNYNYGVKVINHASNNQVAGTVIIHSIKNVFVNTSNATIITNVPDPGNLGYKAWKAVTPDFLFAITPFVTNFIAAVDNLTYSAFTPVQMIPDSFWVVANVVEAGVPGHSTTYAPPASTYNYGVVHPSAASDPDAIGNVYLEKVTHSIGWVNANIPDMRRKSLSNVVRWSDPIIQGSKVNNLNAWLDDNRYVVDYQRSGVQAMFAMNDHTMFCVHQSAMTSLYISRAIMISPSEVQNPQDQLFLTNSVVGNDNKLTSNMGTLNNESCKVVESGTIAYGFDIMRKCLWQKTVNGVRNLTYECNVKTLFNTLCANRLLAQRAGEDVKVYVGYNEKEKTFYMTFAPFIYKGQSYPGMTIGYNAYLDGFISRYSFEPVSYLATEDNLFTIKTGEFNNPSFNSNLTSWLQTNANGGTVDWTSPHFGCATANTTPLVGSKILNPDFSAGSTNWNTYGGGSVWSFVDDVAITTIAAGGSSRDLVSAVAGVVGSYKIRLRVGLPVTGLTFAIKIYNGAGVVQETVVATTALAEENILGITQTLAGKVGLIINNTGGSPVTVRVYLFDTIVRTKMLYQLLPLTAGLARLRVSFPTRAGSARAYVYAFNDPLNPIFNLIGLVSLIDNKGAFEWDLVANNPVATKYVGFYVDAGYDLAQVDYFNINSFPSIWAHGPGALINNFYGIQYSSSISLVFVADNAQVLIYNGIAIEAGDVWVADSLVTSNGNVSALSAQNYRTKDGVFYANLLRDMRTPQDSLKPGQTPILHGHKLTGDFINIRLVCEQNLRRTELKGVYLGFDPLSGHFMNRV